MNVHHTLICFFFLSALQEGNNGLVKAQVYSGTEGGDVTVRCPSSSLVRSRKIFCKEPCQQEDILIETNNIRAQKGRYRIEWIRGSEYVHATITQLTKSDSGLYRCATGSLYLQIELIIVDALLDGNPSEEKNIYSKTGGNILVECFFTTSETRKYFCKGECREEDILVETAGFTDQRDRYTIRYVEGYPSGGFLFVSITQLSRSDSGRYRCGLDRPLSPDLYYVFDIFISDAPTTSNPKQAMSSSVPSASTATPTQSLSSTSGSSRPPTGGTSTHYVLLYVGGTLVVVVILLVSVLMFCRKRTSKPNEPPVETQYAAVTEANRVYEDIREDGQSRSPHVEKSSAEINNDYSLITAVNSPNTAEDDSSRLIYSEVTFSHRAVGSSSSAVRGDDDVVYSVPRVELQG